MTVWGNGSKTKPRVTSKYGRRSGGAFSFHYGTDFSGYRDLKSIEDGRCTGAYWMNSAAGNIISVDLDERGPKGETITIVRMHAGRFQIRKGERAAEGRDLGDMGSTGNATGPCDHVEIRYWLNGSYKTVDPEQWIAARIAREAGANTAGARKWPARSMYGAAHVSNVQTLANRLGAKLKVDGYDGPATQAWVKGFQKSHGLNPDAIAGPLTVAKMQAQLKPTPPKTTNRPTLRRGSRGTHVKALQSRLRSNYPAYARNLAVDGAFEGATDKVVREFQKRAGLTVDGVVGPKTWARLGF